MRFKKVLLSDVCELIPGYAFKSKDFGNFESKVIKIANITPPYVDAKSLVGVDLSKYDSSKLKKYIAQEDDYVLAMTGATIGKLGRILSGQAYVNQRVLLFKPRLDIDKDYLYYVVSQPAFYRFILNFIDSETAQPNISASTIGKFELELPEMVEQIQCAKILKSIDNKIALNQKINDNLEQQAQALYQKQFSNEEHCNGLLADICGYSKDRISVSDLSVSNYYSTENMLPDRNGAVDAASLPAAAQTTKCHSGDTLISNIRPYFKKILYCHDECGCSADVLCFTPTTPENSAYLFNTLYSDKFFEFVMSGAKGTKMPRGDKKQIMTYPIHIPTNEELASFNSVAIPILQMIQNNRAENKRLSELRDTLLPKLMSGEIDVPDVEI